MNFPAIIISGGTPDARKSRAELLLSDMKTAPVDTISIPSGPEETIKIEDVRILQKQFYLSPVASRGKTAMLYELQNATIEAQQSLLKLLEEPPHNSSLVLTVDTIEKLLPTVLSRCHIIKLQTLSVEPTEEAILTIRTILQSGEGERLARALTIAETKDTAVSWLQQTINTTRFMIKNTVLTPNTQSLVRNIPVTPFIRMIRQLNRALQTLQTTNTNPRLLIENLLLELPRF